MLAMNPNLTSNTYSQENWPYMNSQQYPVTNETLLSPNYQWSNQQMINCTMASVSMSMTTPNTIPNVYYYQPEETSYTTDLNQVTHQTLPIMNTTYYPSQTHPLYKPCSPLAQRSISQNGEQIMIQNSNLNQRRYSQPSFNSNFPKDVSNLQYNLSNTNDSINMSELYPNFNSQEYNDNNNHNNNHNINYNPPNHQINIKNTKVIVSEGSIKKNIFNGDYFYGLPEVECPVGFNKPRTKQTIIPKGENVTVLHCKYCRQPFYRKNSLARHEMLHLGSKPHFCNPCNKGFSRKDIYRRHLMSRRCKRDKNINWENEIEH